MHIVSWNVAGWRTCVTEMSRSGVEDWVERLDCDILCLQETKVRGQQVADDVSLRPRPSSGYESYWSCNEGKGGQRAGLNGVATFSRLAAVSADPSPLGDPELDAEGRALMVDFGAFCVLNLYAPNGSSPERRAIHARFFEACKRLVLRQTKPVVVAGDLNSNKRDQDSHWSFAAVDLSKLPDVSDRVKIRQIVTKNSKTGEEFLKFKLFCDECKPVGQPRSSQSDSRYDDPVTCAEVYKTLGIEVEKFEYLSRARPNPLFDILVDPFEILYPDAEERFTCWDQRTNRRYENMGARIDYILCDHKLLANPVRDPLLKKSRSDALDDATLSGAFRPAPYEGGGVPEAPRHAYRAHLHRSKATTIIYTPPAWSDHVAVSLLVDDPPSDGVCANDSACRKAQPHKSTRSITHFFKPQKRSSSEKDETESSAAKASIEPSLKKTKKKEGALFRYFQPAS